MIPYSERGARVADLVHELVKMLANPDYIAHIYSLGKISDAFCEVLVSALGNERNEDVKVAMLLELSLGMSEHLCDVGCEAVSRKLPPLKESVK